nr:isoprenylcysteine carboxylmethyltransferase family protein [Providencia sneebia]
MNILKFPFINWLVLNGIAAYFLYIKGALIFNYSSWLGIIAILVVLESFGWIGMSLVYFRRHKTSSNPMIQASTLITDGPFKFSRNPIYLALTSMSIGFALFTHSFYFLLAGFIFWLLTDLYTIPHEEKFLSGRFKEEWHRYSRQTRRWLWHYQLTV